MRAPPREIVRWPELDVARAVIVAGLIFFHAALVFASDDDFYVKNDRTSDLVTLLAAPVVVWAMRLARRLAAYVRPAVLPWYVLHQPVEVAVAFVVVGRPLPPVAKYAVICALSVLITLALYDVLVRRTAVTRALFGVS